MNIFFLFNPFATMGTKVNLTIYNLIELLIRATIQNTEVGILISLSHKRLNSIFESK